MQTDLKQDFEDEVIKENEEDEYDQTRKALIKIGKIINAAQLNAIERIMSKLKNLNIEDLRLAVKWIDGRWGEIGEFVEDFSFDENEDLHDLIRKALDEQVTGG